MIECTTPLSMSCHMLGLRRCPCNRLTCNVQHVAGVHTIDVFADTAYTFQVAVTGIAEHHLNRASDSLLKCILPQADGQHAAVSAARLAGSDLPSMRHTVAESVQCSLFALDKLVFKTAFYKYPTPGRGRAASSEVGFLTQHTGCPLR